MKFISKYSDVNSRRFELENTPDFGCYFYIYENGKCVRDYLQDTLEQAIGFAFEYYQVPKDSWVKIEK